MQETKLYCSFYFLFGHKTQWHRPRREKGRERGAGPDHCRLLKYLNSFLILWNLAAPARSKESCRSRNLVAGQSLNLANYSISEVGCGDTTLSKVGNQFQDCLQKYIFIELAHDIKDLGGVLIIRGMQLILHVNHIGTYEVQYFNALESPYFYHRNAIDQAYKLIGEINIYKLQLEQVKLGCRIFD